MEKKIVFALVSVAMLGACAQGRFYEDSHFYKYRPTEAMMLEKQMAVYGWSCEQLAAAFREADTAIGNYFGMSVNPILDDIAMKRATLSRMDDKECPTLNVLRDQADLQEAINTLADE